MTLQRQLLLFGVLLVMAVQVAAQQDCEAIIQDVLASVSELCAGTERNQACYGNVAVEAVPRGEIELQFTEPGDLEDLTHIRALRTAPLDTNESELGVALLRLQANVEGALPGQAVSFLLIGDVSLADESPDDNEMPLQVFTLATGVGQSRCSEQDYDTLLVRTPEGVASVNFTVNGVEVELGSTAVIVTTDSLMDVLVTEGEGVVTAEDSTVTVPAGNWTQIPLDETGAAAAVPAAPEPFEPERIAHLPFDLLDAGLNIALNKPTTASQSLDDYPSALAVDGRNDPNTWWGAGDFPPQWWEVDLLTPSNIAQIHLYPDQFPFVTYTRHQLYVAGADRNFRLEAEFSGVTNDQEPILYTPAAPLTDVQYIRIETLESESWVAWSEVVVIGAGVILADD
ncbi:MAG: hypothetical protein OHK0046_10250 [Anaerolineae bacterium]